MRTKDLRGATGIWIRRLVIAALSVLISAGLAAAQEEGRKWSANVGAGFTPLLGDLNKRLDNGWHVTFGAGWRVTRRLTLGGQVMYNGLGVSRGVLNEFAVPDGNAHVWAFTAEPRLSFAPRHHFSPYLIGGVGYYRRVVEFTRPTIAAVNVFDPFLFGFIPVLVPADQVIGRITRDGIGGNAGLGFEFGMRGGVKIFTEARFHYADTGAVPTRMIPVTIGVRF
jgi:Outer membrane protein beta-barrel domain